MASKSVQSDVPSVDEIREGVDAAFAAHGYVHDDGVTRDPRKLVARVSVIVQENPVNGLKERNSKAVAKGALTKQVFPDAAGPDSWGEQDNPRLAEEVWRKLVSLVWSQATMGARSSLQKLVASAMGNGFVLCRTKIGTTDLVDAIYITDNFACIMADVMTQDDKSVDRAVQRWLANRSMLIDLRPENRDAILRKGTSTLNALNSRAKDQLRLALESATANGTEPDEGTEV